MKPQVTNANIPAAERDALQTRLNDVFTTNAQAAARLVPGYVPPALSPRPSAEVIAEEHRQLLIHLRRALRLSPDAELSITITRPEMPLVPLAGLQLSIRSGDQQILTGEVRRSFFFTRISSLNGQSPLLQTNRPESLNRLLLSGAALDDLNQRENIARINLPPGGRGTVSAFLDDPGLRHLAPVYRELQNLEESEAGRTRISALYPSGLPQDPAARNRQRADAAGIISRMLVSRGEAPTSEAISACIERVAALRQRHSALPLFHNRTVVIGAGEEPSFFAAHLGFGEGARGMYRFGHPGLLSAIRDNGASSVALHRGVLGAREGMEAVISRYDAVVHEVGRPDSQLTPLKRTALANFTAEVRQALGLAENAAIRITFTAGNERGVLRVFSGMGTEPLYEATVQTSGVGARNFVLPRVLEVARAPNTPERRTPVQARAGLLEAIRTTEPGSAGFTFIFDGHGLRNGIFMGGGAEGGAGGISPREFADAIIDRRRRFGEQTNNDIYLFASCLSHDFASEVGRLLGPTNAHPIFYTTAEYGQAGYSHSYATADMVSIFDSAARVRAAGRQFNLGDLIRLMSTGLSPGVNGTNPSLIVPESVPRQGDIPARSIYHPIAQVHPRLVPDIRIG